MQSLKQLSIKLIKIYICILTVLVYCPIVNAQTVKVIDGDTIRLDDKNIRLYGIDAPELKQNCFDANQKPWQCGLVAKFLLSELIKDQQVTCINQGVDIYRRELAICYIGKIDLNKAMVQKGMAVAYTQYSDKYKIIESKAQKYFLGIWNSSFMLPKQYRLYSKYLNKIKKLSMNN